MRLEAHQVEASAVGRWPGILGSLGVDEKFLRNVHGPCPLCGGEDRYRFDDKDGTGSYYCNHCGAGRGFKLLMELNGWTFPETLGRVAEMTGSAPISAAPTQRGDPAESIKRLLAGCSTDRSPVWDYLRGRGISETPNELKYHPACDYYHDGKFVARYPAMIAAVRNANGRLISLHRTYLADIAPRKKTMAGIGGTIRGSAIRLFEPTETLGVAEGIETAIAAHELSGRPVWATYSAQNMELFVPPEGVKNVVIFGDTDESFTGQASAYVLAKKLTTKGYRVAVKVPMMVGDWLDVLNAQREAA